MILSFKEHELKTKIGCNLLHGIFVEKVLLEKYKYYRKEGIDYTIFLVEEFLKQSFDMSKQEVRIESLLSKEKIITVTYGVFDKLTVLLLMEIEDLNFKEILFKCKEKDVYQFEVIY